MSHRKTLSANAERLEPPSPNQERVQTIRAWHIRQATNDSEPVALLNLSITSSGHIKTSGVGIEPAHALVFLTELDAVRDRLMRFAHGAEALARTPAQVIPLRRTA